MYSIETGKYNPADHKNILLRKIEAEKRLLADPRRGLPVMDYRTNRTELYENIEPEISKRVRKGQPVKVLEIGAGSGRVMEQLADRFRKYPNLELAMTNLTPMNPHHAVKKKGVTVYTGVLVERLPSHWTDTFDVIGTDSPLAYSDMPQALQEIDRVLKPGGVWFGLEGYFTPNGNRTSTIRKDIRRVMGNLGMRNSAGWFTRMALFMSPDGEAYAIKYVKPQPAQVAA